jgi:membrane protein implicated in regulation of membrane protease activity
MRWYQSIAVKSFMVAFVATHVPLLSLIALVVMAPEWLTPLGVLAAAMGATLLAAVLVALMLRRFFAPLRLAADSLKEYTRRGLVPRLQSGWQDEIGRLFNVMVHALAHLDRSRASLLRAAGVALDH